MSVRPQPDSSSSRPLRLQLSGRLVVHPDRLLQAEHLSELEREPVGRLDGEEVLHPIEGLLQSHGEHAAEVGDCQPRLTPTGRERRSGRTPVGEGR